MSHDLSQYLEPAADRLFEGRYPQEFLVRPRPESIAAWHLVGGKDPVEPSDLTGDEPDDGYPVLLRDWIRRDGLNCLKVKLRGDDAGWDYDRLVRVGRIAVEEAVDWLTADFNCTVGEPDYVNAILDRLCDEHPRLYGMLLYVEQPFPYDLEAHRIDVHSVSARKPLFMDESAHDWRFVRLGRELGWTGVALKTCKTHDRGDPEPLLGPGARDDDHGPGPLQPDARPGPARPAGGPRRDHHGRRVQRHAVLPRRLAPRGGRPSRAVPPRHGRLDLSTLRGPGFGYRIDEIDRTLPEPALLQLRDFPRRRTHPLSAFRISGLTPQTSRLRLSLRHVVLERGRGWASFIRT